MSLDNELSQDRGAASVREAEPGPAPLRFSCPHCGMILEVAGSMAGVRAPCPGCREQIEAPLPTTPRAIEIKPRLTKPPREAEAPSTPPPSESLPPKSIPAMGQPPVTPPISHPTANPPIPRQPPIPAPRKEEEGGEEGNQGESRSKSGRSVRRRSTSRPGRSVTPVTGFSEKYQDRKESIVIIKIVLAVLVTAAIALTIAAITKKSFGTPGYEEREPDSKKLWK